MKTIKFANGTERDFFLENNCYQCKRYDCEDVDKTCQVGLKIEIAQELTDEELEEYFNGKPVEHYHKCLKKGGGDEF